MLKIIKYIIYLTAMTMCMAQASGCNRNDSIISVPASEFQKDIHADSVQLVDVRTPQEFAEGHIEGAVNINVQSDDFQQEAEKELSKDSTILVYCRSGRRSMTAADILTRLGYKVVNLEGGIIEWKDAGLTVTAAE